MDEMTSENGFAVLKCEGCGRHFTPPRYRCHRCDGTSFREAFLKGEGEIYSYTVIWVPPEDCTAAVPYAFAEMKLDEGIVVPGRIEQPDEKALRVGARVAFVRRDMGVNTFRIVSP